MLVIIAGGGGRGVGGDSSRLPLASKLFLSFSLTQMGSKKKKGNEVDGELKVINLSTSTARQVQS